MSLRVQGIQLVDTCTRLLSPSRPASSRVIVGPWPFRIRDRLYCFELHRQIDTCWRALLPRRCWGRGIE